MGHSHYSIRTLFSVTTFIVMALAIVILSMKLMPLQAEIERLRSEVGELTIHDPDKLYTIEIPGVSDTEWTWRVYLPEGEYTFDLKGNYRGHLRSNYHGVKSTAGKEIIVRAALKEEEFSVNIDGEYDSIHIGQPEEFWEGLGGSWSVEGLDTKNQQEWEPDSNVVFLQGKDSGHNDTDDPITFGLSVRRGPSEVNEALRKALQSRDSD